MLPLLLQLFGFVQISHSANIFAGAFFGGSHLTAIYDVALILAEAGHNVTFVNVLSGGLEKCSKHPNILGVDIGVWDDEDVQRVTVNCLADVIKRPSGVGMTSGCVPVWTEIWNRSASVFSGEKVLSMFRETQFDVILGEAVTSNGMALLGTLTDVPVINYQPSFYVQLSLLHGNLPMLTFSQPSMVLYQEFDHPPSFKERLSVYFKFYELSPFITIGEEAMRPFLEKFGFSGLEDVEDSVKLFLTNDHPAFTFPFLRPPNDIPIGCANLVGSKRDPIVFSPKISQFLEESEGKDVVYVSFGSYVKMSEDFSWFPNLLNILIELDLRIIVKADEKSGEKFPKSVLPLSWAPQKDLLRSGKVKLFISHCGNNGRLETTFYNVPVLCIPLFADQPICAEFIKLNGFGEGLIKENIPDQAKDLVSAMIANHATYSERMKEASDIVESEPGNVREKMIFYVEHVAKYKNVDYLVNKVIKQQSLVQIYNLDIIIPACVIFFFIAGLCLYVFTKLCKCVIRRYRFCTNRLKKE